jgi:hypothetical protein
MTYEQTAVAEQQFWLQVLGDHARFIYHALAPNETTEIERSHQFMQVFDDLLTRSRQSLPADDLMNVNQLTLKYATRIRAFKLHLLKRHLVGQIGLSLSPSFLNHMVNETEECLRIFQHLCKNNVPPVMHPIHHHLLWLSDAYIHTAILNSQLDFVEMGKKEQTEFFQKKFEAFYLKSVELAGYLRAHIDEFPALRRFNHDVELEMRLFQTFLHELEEMELSEELLGTLTALIPDHMAREECYYLTKLSEVSDVTPQSCNPTKPRMET